MRQAAKPVSTALAALLISTLGAIPAAAKSTTYHRVDEVMDWGASTTKLIVDLGAEVPTGSVDADSFTVHVERRDPRLEEPLLGEGVRTVVDAFISDDAGAPVDEGRYATLVMEVGPDLGLSHALNFAFEVASGDIGNVWADVNYTITQQKPIGDIAEGLEAVELDQHIRPLIDDFTFASASYDDEEYGAIELAYAHYRPAEDDGENPLIVWLHGGGEGGSDPSILLAANRANRLASDDIQKHFGGAYVLAPQSPTYWMHGPEEWERGVDDKPDAESIYAGAVQDLVESYVSENPDIDTDRIYVGGLSNGGFLTVRLVLDHPDYYAAALPICGPINLDYISEEELQAIVDLPMWLVGAATDDTVSTSRYPAALYDRLQLLGAATVHFSLLPRVTDQSGLYTQEDGSPYEYPGHFSWIPVYNNHLAIVEGAGGELYGEIAKSVDEIGGRNVTSIMEWWAAQSR